MVRTRVYINISGTADRGSPRFVQSTMSQNFGSNNVQVQVITLILRDLIKASTVSQNLLILRSSKIRISEDSVNNYLSWEPLIVDTIYFLRHHYVRFPF